MDEDALRLQRQRGIALRHHLRKLGDRDYDPDAALLRSFSAFFPRFTGHAVGQNSLEYALLLLHSDDRTYGTDDKEEANRIIRTILRHQDLREGSESFGNFFWMTHWQRVKDANAVSFLTPGLVYAYLTFPEKLEDETREALERAFPHLLAGVHGHRVRWGYTNIFWLNLGALVGLARVLEDESVHEEAVGLFDEWLSGTDPDGLHEFNSPTYTGVTLFGIEAAWANTPDERFRERLQRTLDLLAYQLALNLFPSGVLGGAAARAYQRDILLGAGHSNCWAHVKLGTPRLSAGEDPSAERVMFANYTLYDYVPPPGVRRLATDKPEQAEVLDRTLSIGSRRTHQMTRRYSIASQCMERVGGHSPPAYVFIVRDTQCPRRTVAIIPDESFSHLPCASFQSRQSGGRVLGRLRYDLPEGGRERFLEDPAYVCEPRALLGPREEIAGVRVGNVDWGGAPVQLLPGQPVAVSYGNLMLGLVVLALGQEGEPVTGHAFLEQGEDGELRLRIPLFGGPELQPTDEPAEALVLVDVRAQQPEDSLQDYAHWLAGWRLSLGEGGEPAFSATHPDEPALAFPYSDADPDSIGAALHISPDLTLAPGDMTKLIEGTLTVPILER